MTPTVEIRYEDIIKECDSILHDLSLNVDVDIRKLNDMIISYFPSIGSEESFNHHEAEEISEKMKKIEALLAIQRDSELAKNLSEIEKLKKYKKYMDVIDMVEEE